MTRASQVRAAALAACLVASSLALPGCRGLRTLPSTRLAAVIYAPSRAADAEKAERLLVDDGWSVSKSPTGPAKRSRSSVAVYDTRTFPKLADHVTDLLDEVPGLETLPFLQDGPGGTRVVVWLAE